MHLGLGLLQLHIGGRCNVVVRAGQAAHHVIVQLRHCRQVVALWLDALTGLLVQRTSLVIAVDPAATTELAALHSDLNPGHALASVERHLAVELVQVEAAALCDSPHFVEDRRPLQVARAVLRQRGGLHDAPVNVVERLLANAHTVPVIGNEARIAITILIIEDELAVAPPVDEEALLHNSVQRLGVLTEASTAVMEPLVGAMELAGLVVALLGNVTAVEGGRPGALYEAVAHIKGDAAVAPGRLAIGVWPYHIGDGVLAVGELGGESDEARAVMGEDVLVPARDRKGAVEGDAIAVALIHRVLADVERISAERDDAVGRCLVGAVQCAGRAEATVAVGVVGLEGAAQDTLVIRGLHLRVLDVLLLVMRPALVGAVEDVVVVVLHLVDGPRDAALAAIAAMLLVEHLADAVLLPSHVVVVEAVEHAIYLLRVVVGLLLCAGELGVSSVVVEADVVRVEESLAAGAALRVVLGHLEDAVAVEADAALAGAYAHLQERLLGAVAVMAETTDGLLVCGEGCRRGGSTKCTRDLEGLCDCCCHLEEPFEKSFTKIGKRA